MLNGDYVLKLRMAPLQVGHLRFLHELESPYAGHEGEISTADLILAAFVCSFPWRESKHYLNRWWTKPAMRFWGWRCRNLELTWEHAAFNAYLSDALKTRKIKNANGGKSLSAPMHQRLWLMLVEELNHDPDKAWDVTVKDAVGMWSARAEKNGTLQFFTPEDEAFIDFHERKNAEWLEQQRRKAA